MPSIVAPFSLALIGATLQSPGSATPPAAEPTPYGVTGVIDAFWEFPNFTPDNISEKRGLPFAIRQEKWSKAIWKPVWKAYKYHPDESVCFRVVGRGFIIPRNPTNMWPAKEEFVFTSIEKLSRLKPAECEKLLR